jgi:molybdopterin/thiamine biosynthesis adenylyltransferase
MYMHVCVCVTGFKGNARVILPGITACIDCTLDLYPPQVCEYTRRPYVSLGHSQGQMVPRDEAIVLFTSVVQLVDE